MNKTDKAKIAEDYRNLKLYANQLSNFVYNVIQNEAAQHAALMGPTVRCYDAARNRFTETLKRHGIDAEQENREALAQRNTGGKS